MQSDMNVWVDGSLRDYEWHATVFKKIRRKYPHYKIAILQIT